MWSCFGFFFPSVLTNSFRLIFCVWLTHILVFFNELGFFFLLICRRSLYFLDVNYLSVTYFIDCVCVCYIFCVNYPYFRILYSVPGSGRSPGGEHSNPLQYSCLENPMDRGAWWALQPFGWQRVRHNWSNLAHAHTVSFIKKNVMLK